MFHIMLMENHSLRRQTLPNLIETFRMALERLQAPTIDASLYEAVMQLLDVVGAAVCQESSTPHRLQATQRLLWLTAGLELEYPVIARTVWHICTQHDV
eukprot:m.104752 g.104752  ORF g.104752 m.104752 type:complete len:99 (+) comp9111_c0_seq1:402-698(+)